MDITALQESFPFLSCIKNLKIEYIGIIQNCDEKFISFYDIGAIVSEDDKKKLLSLGETWWWESSRLIPISIFLHEEMKNYRFCLKTVSRKDSAVLFGPAVSLKELVKQKGKKRSFQMIRKID